MEEKKGWKNYFSLIITYLLYYTNILIRALDDYIFYPLVKNFVRLDARLRPFPDKKKGESNEEWLRRIDIREAVRFVKHIKAISSEVDNEKIFQIIKQIPTKKERISAKEFFDGLKEIHYSNERNYEMVMRRKEILDEMNKS